MDLEIFKEIGFTDAETKIYVALLGLGTVPASPIIHKTKLQNSVVHLTLQKLIDKGTVSFVKKGNKRYFTAARPKTILKLIEEKKKKYQNLLPELETLNDTNERQEAAIFEGFNGLKVALQELILDSKPKDEYLYFSFYTKNSDDFENVFNYYKEFEKERKRKKIIVKGIVPETLRKKERFWEERENIKFVKHPIPLNISIFQDKILMTAWEDRKITFLINSKQMAKQYRDLFYTIWKPVK